eukprot:2105291-Pleurochrysis_carterae.AAC.1
MDYLGQNQKQIVAMPCNLVRMLQDSRCSKRRAKFQWSAGLGKGTMSPCGLDDNCCHDSLEAGLARKR